VDKLAQKAAGRNTEDQTIGPILSWTTEAMLGHVEALRMIPGASLAFGGERLEGHSIPKQYGAITPTAVFVPLAEILKPENFELVTTEVFGPVQVPLPPPSFLFAPLTPLPCFNWSSVLYLFVQATKTQSAFFRSRHSTLRARLYYISACGLPSLPSPFLLSVFVAL